MKYQTHIRLLIFCCIYLLFITCFYFTVVAINTKHLLLKYESVIQQFGNYSTIIIRNDDISAISDLNHEKRIFSIFEKYDIPQVIGVIPYVSENCSTCIDPAFHDIRSAPMIISYFSNLRDRGLVEIGQHGYRHCSNHFHNMAYNSLSEFSDLSYSEQYKNISIGKTILKSAFNQEINIFLPPYNRYDKITANVLDDLNFTILSGGTGTNLSNKLSTINRNSSFFELNKYLLSEKSEFPPYFFVMYHSYELKNDHDFNVLDSTLLRAKNHPDIRFSTLVNFKNEYNSQIQEIESLGIKFNKLLNTKWFSCFYINHFTRRITDQSFKTLENSLRLHDIRLLKSISGNLLHASTVNVLIKNLLIILFFRVTVFVSILSRDSIQRRLIIIGSTLILLIKISGIIIILMRYNQFHFVLSELIFLTTIGFCLFVFSGKLI